MGRIRVLDPHVVNQIAAGEVIERPASVVKELVENAIDAGARRITVRVAEGGRALVEVADDGWGMDADDLACAFLPHATSKVSTVDDLEHVGSLGFRGEALASIASVARVRIVSRARDADAGAAIESDRGRMGEVTPAAASPGTVVRVEGLFLHVPARRKFLRSAATELGHVVASVGRFAVAHPDVAFRLAQASRTLLETAAGEDRRARIASVHGAATARDLLGVEDASGDLALEAWIGPPWVHRSDGRLEQVFVGGRHVRDRTAAHALRQAYADLLPPGGKRPIAFLFLACDPSRVDVNVHPAKAEVRWRDGGAVHRLVFRALRRTLEEVAPGVPLELPQTDAPPSAAEAVEFAFTRGVGSHSGADVHRHAQPPGGGGRARDEAAAPVRPAAELRPVGRVLGTYLVLEDRDAVVLVDQHALHERVLHEEITRRVRDAGRLEVQGLLVPVVVHLDPADAAIVDEERALLRTLGWDVEAFGDDAVAVRGHPALLRRPDPEKALLEILAVLEQGARDELDAARLLGEAIERLACRAAVMAGDTLDDEEVLELLRRAEALDHSHSCPHGRPTRLTLSRAQLERFFHRLA